MVVGGLCYFLRSEGISKKLVLVKASLQEKAMCIPLGLRHIVRDISYAQIQVRAKFDQNMIEPCVPGRALSSLGGVAVDGQVSTRL